MAALPVTLSGPVLGPLGLFAFLLAFLLAACAPAPSASSSEQAEGVRVVRAQVRGIT